MVFPSLYCSEVSSSLFEVSYNITQRYDLISGYALGRHKVNGGIPDGWQFGYSTALRFQIDSALLEHTQVVCEDILLLFVHLTVDYLMCTMLNRIQTLHAPKHDSH